MVLPDSWKHVYTAVDKLVQSSQALALCSAAADALPCIVSQLQVRAVGGYVPCRWHCWLARGGSVYVMLVQLTSRLPSINDCCPVIAAPPLRRTSLTALC